MTAINRLTFIGLFLSFIFLFSCNNKNKVNLVETNAHNEVPTQGNLSFVFDKDLVPDSLIDTWSSTEYISFKPEISGKFRWASNSELVFSPASSLPPSTQFKATVNKELVSHSKFSLGKIVDISFYTKKENIESINVMWDVRNNNQVAIKSNLYFFYEEDPKVIQDLLSVKLDEKDVPFSITTTERSSIISFDVLNIKVEDRPYKLDVSVKKGLTPPGGTQPTDKDLNITAGLSSPLILNITSFQSNHDGLEGRLTLYTSQKVVSENIDNFISISPSVKFKVNQTEEGIEIYSDQFNASNEYKLTVSKGLRGIIGGLMKENYETTFSFGNMEPSINFINEKAMFLSGKGYKNIEARITGIKRVIVTVSKIYENNIASALRYGYRPNDNDYYDEYEDYNEDRSYDIESTLGDVVYEDEIDVKEMAVRGNSRVFKFDLQDKLPDFWGIYHISIRSTEDYWIRDNRFISVSDIGLIAKEGKDVLYVFANSISNTEPIPNVIIQAYGANNQVIGTSSTNKEGVAKIEFKKKSFSGFKPAMITARNGTDFNCMPFSRTHVEKSRFDVGGKWISPSGFDAFLYSERDLYRPAEKVNITGVIRNYDWKTPESLPLKIKVLMPNGSVLKEYKKGINEQGSFELNFDLSPTALTGSYQVMVFTSNDVLLNSLSFLVEEFMPDRIRVLTSPDKKMLNPGATLNFELEAQNLFGTAASNRKFEIEQQISRKNFSHDKFKNYNFDIVNTNSYFENNVQEGTTNEQGKATVQFNIPNEFKNMGLLEASYFTTVFDETGRPVNKFNTIPIYTQSHYIGIGTDRYYYYPINQPIQFPVVAINRDKQISNVKARVIVIKHEYKTNLVKTYDSYYRYESSREDKTMLDQSFDIQGESTVFKYIATSPGDYEVRLSIPGANSYVKEQFYCYGWAGGYQSFEANTEGNIEIETDKASYKPGETAKVFFKTPFNGKVLVTLEKDEVLEHYIVATEKRLASLDISLKENYLPNVYVSATLIKPHQESDLPLMVAHGFKSIQLDAESKKIAVEIQAPKSVRSKTHQKVTVKAAPNSKVTLAVVDEGILQITNFKSPDPYNHFYSKRTLGVESFDLYPLLFPEIKSLRKSTGGDGFDLSKRTNPIQNKRVKLVSYWSGITDANGSANAQFEFDIPQFSGELRLMAVAYKDDQFGSSTTTMKVADPLVISTGLPRFASPGDTLDMAITLSNTTTSRTNAQLKVETSGPFSIVGNPTAGAQIDPGKENRIVLRVAAKNSIGLGKIKVSATSGNETFIDETELSVRPASGLQKLTGSGIVNKSSVSNVNLSSGDFIPSTVDYYLMVSSSPAAELGSQLEELVHYPYGCTEQTISAAFPQLYFGDISQLMNRKGNNQLKNIAGSNVQEAIRKIQMRQLYNGGISLWDGGEDHWYASVYSAHFLLEAQKAGFDFETSVLSKLISYLQVKLRDKKTFKYFYNGQQSREVAFKEIPYSLFVLALAGQPQSGTMNFYKDNPSVVSLDGKYLLAAAFAISGDKSKAKELLPNGFTGEISQKQSGGSFYSPIRDEAISLYALLHIDPNNPQIGEMASHVVKSIKSSRYLSTQEMAFSILSIGKLARQDAGTSNAEVSVNNKVVGSMQGGTIKLNAKELNGMNIQINNKGTGKVYYFWQAEGISSTGSIKEEDQYVKVRRTFYNRFGQEVSPDKFKQNDLVVICATIENLYNSDIENLVVTDILPAGFEIENSRTKEIPGMNWIKDESTADQVDVRDDRVNLFFDMNTKSKKFYYAVRCVTPGTYKIGSISADALYQGEIHSYSGAGKVRIE